MTGRTGQQLAAMRAIEKAAAIHPAKELRDEALAALALPDWEPIHEPALQLPADIGLVAADPQTGRWVAASDEQGIITGEIGLNGWRTILKKPKFRIARLNLSPGGKYAGWAMSRHLVNETALCGLVTTTGEPQASQLGRWEPLAWAPDGSAVLVANDLGDFELRRLADGHIDAAGNTADPILSGLVLQRGAGIVLKGRTSYQLFHKQNDRFVPAHQQKTGAMLAAEPRGHPSADVVAIGADISVALWNLNDQRSITLGRHERPHIRTLFHPSGRWLLSHAVDGASILWSVSTGKPVIRGEIGQPLAFSANGHELWALQNGQIRRLRFHPSSVCRILSSRWGTSELVGRPSYYASGRLLVGVDIRSFLSFWVDGQPIPATSFAARNGQASFLHDGRLAMTGLPASIRSVSITDGILSISSPENAAIPDHALHAVTCLTQSPDEAELAAVVNGEVVVLDGRDRTLAINLSGTGDFDISGMVSGVNSDSLVFEIGAMGSSDLVTLSGGPLKIGTGLLEFDDFDFSALVGLTTNSVHTLFDGNMAIIGTLGANLTGTVGGIGAFISFGDGGNDLVLTVVPEPGTAAVGLALLGVAMGRRRRRA